MPIHSPKHAAPLASALLLATALPACDRQQVPAARHLETPAATTPSENEEPEKAIEYREISWEQLIPKDDLEALLEPPQYLDEIAEGSLEDQLSEKLDQAVAAARPGGAEEAADSRYRQALNSKRIMPEFDRTQVRIPGFVVPLEFDEAQIITSFLLVPYFGACIHLPPPPPNQVIHASFPEGLQVEALYDPFYVEGQLRTLPVQSELGSAAYSMRVKKVFPYEE